MCDSQLADSTQDESCCIYLQVEQVFDHPAIRTKSVWSCGVIYRDISRWTNAEIWCIWDINSTFSDQKEFCSGFSQEIPGIPHETDAQYHIMMYGSHCYAQSSDSQNADFALFRSIKPTNLDIHQQQL